MKQVVTTTYNNYIEEDKQAALAESIREFARLLTDRTDAKLGDHSLLRSNFYYTIEYPEKTIKVSFDFE